MNQPLPAAAVASAVTAAPVLATHALAKSYGSRVAVQDLNLELQRGEILGFLGPNGAGKTTTIRMVLGLIRPTAGSVEVLGREVTSHRAEVLPRVGALVETPALYNYLSGRDNLKAFAAGLGGVPRLRIDEVLEIVDLASRQRDKVKSYSLGMKQRLGLAVALLNDPEILVLDEPANGLDPAGIVEMRDLLRRLAAGGKSIFISSHVLGEVQQICDRVAIINLGRLVRVAPVAELLASHGVFAVKVDSAADALAAIKRQPWGGDARIEDGVLLTPSPNGRGRDLVSFLVQSGFVPDMVSEHQQSLEHIFLSLTGGVE